MAITLAVRQALIVDDKVVEGSLESNTSITLASGQSYVVQDKTIADDYGEDVLWATGDGGLDTFTHGFIISNQDIWVQLRNDDTGAAEYVRMYVPANVFTFIPAKIAGNATDAFDGAALEDNTDYADTDQIEVARDVADTTGDAVVSLFLFG